MASKLVAPARTQSAEKVVKAKIPRQPL